jgi:hypothetical protein
MVIKEGAPARVVIADTCIYRHLLCGLDGCIICASHHEKEVCSPSSATDEEKKAHSGLVITTRPTWVKGVFGKSPVRVPVMS